MNSPNKRSSFSLKPQAEIVVAILICILSVVLRFFALDLTDLGTGPDAYFYIEQTRTLVQNFSMAYPDFSLVYVPFVLAASFTDDYLLGVKIGSALISGIFLLTLFIAARENTLKHLVPLVLISFALFSPDITFLAGHYPKALLGLAGVNLFLAAIGTKNIRWVLPSFMLNQAIFPLTGWVVFVFFVAFLVSRKKVQWLPFSFLVMAVCSLLIPNFWFLHNSNESQQLFGVGYAFHPLAYLKNLGIGSIPVIPMIEAILLLGVLLYSAMISLSGRLEDHPQRRMFYYLVGVAIFLLFPIFNSQSFRVGLTGALMLAFCMPLLILPLREIHTGIKWGLIAIFIGASFFSWRSYSPEKLNPEYAEYRVISEKLNDGSLGIKPELLIARHPLCYFIAYHSKIRSRPWLDNIEMYSPGLLQRISSGLSLEEVQPLLDSAFIQSVKPIHHGYLLWEESAWKGVKERARVEGKDKIENKMVARENPSMPEDEFRDVNFLVIP